MSRNFIRSRGVLYFKYAINNLTAVVKTGGFAELSKEMLLDFLSKAADARRLDIDSPFKNDKRCLHIC